MTDNEGSKKKSILFSKSRLLGNSSDKKDSGNSGYYNGSNGLNLNEMLKNMGSFHSNDKSVVTADIRNRSKSEIPREAFINLQKNIEYKPKSSFKKEPQYLQKENPLSIIHKTSKSDVTDFKFDIIKILNKIFYRLSDSATKSKKKRDKKIQCNTIY